MKYKNIIAVSQDGLDVAINVYTFEILSQEADFNLLNAVAEASREFIGTSEGRAIYEDNFEHFEWSDVYNIPDAICAKYGFRKVGSDVVDDEIRNADEQLAYGEEEDDEWVTYTATLEEW